MALIDGNVRQLPGALKEESAADESFAGGLLDGPHYTRPEVWRGQSVPDVLLSGHHAEIAAWRRAQRLAVTARVRPDLQLLQQTRGNAQGAAPAQGAANEDVPSSGAATATPAGVNAAG